MGLVDNYTEGKIMTKQEYKELLIETSLNGGFPALICPSDPLCGCAYRSPDGKKCAVGLLIPDDRYIKAYEFNGVSGLLYQTGKDIIPEGITMSDLCTIQEIHDTLSRQDAGRWNHKQFLEEIEEVFKEDHAE